MTETVFSRFPDRQRVDMLSSETAGVLMMVTLVVSAVMMPMAYVAKHRWYNIRLTRALSATGVSSMAVFMLLAYFYLPG